MATNGGGGRRHKFFKVLLPGSFEFSLCVPPKFAAGLGAWRPWRAAATVRDPTGRSWDVDLHRDGDHRVSFTGRGWARFVSANGISAGHLLVFEHHRGSFDFAVELFDASGCLSDIVCPDYDGQRETKIKTSGGARDNGCKNNEDDDDGLKVVDERRTTTEISGDKESGNKRRAGPAAVPPCTGVKRMKRSASTATTASCEEDEEDASAAGRGRRCDDDETLCLRIERPYQLRLLDLSKSFCERIGWTASRDVELCICVCNEEERRWAVSVKVSSKGGMMCGGWAAFAQDNGLTLSDSCVFHVPPPPLVLQQAASSSSSDVVRVQILR